MVWAGGVRASRLGTVVRDATGCATDRLGRIMVEPDLSVPGHPDIFVIGDLAHIDFKGAPLPCVAPAAIQAGKYVGRVIRAHPAGAAPPGRFTYFDKGNLATIGRSSAVGEFRGVRFWGFPAWLIWLVIHLVYLIGFENRMLVLIRWINTFISRHRGARLITRTDPEAPG